MQQKFTLIEVLVVVAIIGILASLLLPSLSKARMTSRIAVCKSNLKQVYTAQVLFADDNDGMVFTNTRGPEWMTLTKYNGNTTPNDWTNVNIHSDGSPFLEPYLGPKESAKDIEKILVELGVKVEGWNEYSTNLGITHLNEVRSEIDPKSINVTPVFFIGDEPFQGHSQLPLIAARLKAS